MTLAGDIFHRLRMALGVLVLMADGSVRSVKKNASATSWYAAISFAGNDVPGPDW